MVLNSRDEATASVKLNPKGGVSKKKCFIASKNPKDHKFGIVNPCEGLLCLSEPKQNNPVVVCNPMTGEFIKLPKASKVEKSRECNILFLFGCGLYITFTVFTMFIIF
jgi:hypothetical protein